VRTAPLLPVLALLAGPAGAQSTERASVSSAEREANGPSGWIGVAISADGRFVAFPTAATNLVPQHVFGLVLRDLAAGTTELLSVDSSGRPAEWGGDQPSLSGDGRFVAFASTSSDLVPGDTNGFSDVFVHDRLTGVTERISVAADGSQATAYSKDPSISADGRYVAFRSFASNLVPGDTNATEYIFVKDRRSGAVELVSVDSQGGQA
jgi:Tol biopolymer transport system component